ncbi:MAG: PAS domain-containing sensor histidine kinase [Alphaproteobacteria bacterium]
MFSLTKKIKGPEEIFPSSFPDEGAPRIAAREDGSIVYASPAFHELCGGVLPADNILALLGAGNVSALNPGAYRITLPDGAQSFNFHFEWLNAPDEQRYLIGSRIEEPEAKPELELEQFYAMSQDIMLMTALSHEILQVNPVFENIYGTLVERPRGMNFIELFHAEDKPYIRNTIQTTSFDTRRDHSLCMDFAARIIAPDGSQRWIEWRQCQQGETLYYSGRDVTSIKAQELALTAREKQLQQAESIGRMGHWRWTLGVDAFEWSDELYRIFGVSKSFKPSLETMAQLIHKRDMPRVHQAFQRAIIEENDYDMEFRALHPDGDARYIRCEGRCATNETGEVIALYGIMQDMTERMLYERDLKAAKEGAERANAAKTQFLANMSHELRTPLNAVIGFSDVMLKEMLGPVGNEKYVEYIQGIHKSGEHLLDLISDILDMSKMEAGKYELDLEAVNITKTVRLAAHMIEGKALDANVRLNFEGTMDDTLQIIADRRAVLQVMLNLLSNAVKFTKSGGKISIEMQTRGEFVLIKVSDNGIGIPANKLASITKPFEQVFSHYTRDHEGSGLGLAITKELVEMHGGSLQIESMLDVGTSVTVKLPFVAVEKKKA